LRQSGSQSGRTQAKRPRVKRGAANSASPRNDDQFRELADHIRMVFFIANPEPFQITYVSPAYDTIWGRPRQELFENPAAWTNAVHPDDRQRVLGVLGEALGGRETSMEYRVVLPDGRMRWISNFAYPVRDAHGNYLRLVGIAEDITDRVVREKALAEAHDRLNAALAQSERLSRDAARLGEIVDILQSCQTLDEAYKVIEGAVQTALGSRSGALYITSPSRNIVEVAATWGEDAGSDKTFRPEDCWALRRGKPHLVTDPQSPVRCAHVTHAPSSASLCLPLVAQGETLGILYLACSDASIGEAEREALVRQAIAVGERVSLAIANLNLREILRRQSIRDPLTGLFNRRYMEESLERELSRSSRTGEPMALLMFDIDHFKHFNDVFGHQAGDKVLRSFGEMLNSRTRGQDLACRYGGEEFAVILSGASMDAARLRAELLRADLAQMVVEQGGQPLDRVTVSIGIAAAPEHGQNAEEIIRAADRALYRAKSEGRDRIILDHAKVS